MPKKEEDYIKNFNSDREIISQFVITQKIIKHSVNGKPYIELDLLDKTGEIKGRMFPKSINKTYNSIEINTINNIVGKIQEFPANSGKYNILIKKINPARHYEMENFQREVKNIDVEIDKLMTIINRIENSELRQLLNLFFNDVEFTDKFFTSPAAKYHHHNYKGGLLIHTLEVVTICETITELYSEINKDLLITGAILHDIGKIETYYMKDNTIDMTKRGRLIDHLHISASLVEEKMNLMEMNEELEDKLIHMILSHHGETKLGWGSTVDPKIPEAIALHQADDMSAKITGILQKN